MDFSSPSRALLSLDRRRPALPEDILAISKPMFTGLTKLTTSSKSLDGQVTQELTQQYLDGVDQLLTKPDLRWEALAVGVYCGTGLLEAQTNTPASAQDKSTSNTTVYTDGPRVPSSTPSHPAVANMPSIPSPPTKPVKLTKEQTLQLATTLHNISLAHLEHSEPRIRTLVAKAVGAHAAYLVSCNADDDKESANLLKQQCAVLHQRVASSIEEHMQQGREVPVENVEKSTNDDNAPKTAVLDDTTGWRALETNWQCLACFVQPLGNLYFELFPLGILLDQCESSAIEHVNRHVRAAAMLVLEQWVRAAAQADKESPIHAALCKTLTKVLKEGLGDNWSQVRMAASVLCRAFFREYLIHHPMENPKPMYAVVIPRMCLNRFYLAQGVKLYSHDTWRQVFSENGLELVAENVGAVCRYYVKMCDANNHVVREAACQAVAELAVKLSQRYPEQLQPYVSMLLQALLMCFHDESWPVRDEACLACGIFCKAYPEECREELKTLWDRWTEQLTDQIWSVREDAAAALGDAMQAYGKEMVDKCVALVKKLMPSAKDQPAMTMDEYKQKQNDIESHTDAQLYSCGSLAPKLGKKSGAGRIGCSSCDVNRPKSPWEATDGCIYLLRELVLLGSGEEGTNPELALPDDQLLPFCRELADVCRVQHFPQGDDLRATLWRQLPTMARCLGKQRFKRLYLDIFTDLLMSNLERSTASALSKHAAGQCAEELAQLVGYPIFRGRLDDYQQATFDKAMRERQHNAPKGPMDGGAFSPFGPPGMMDPFMMNPPGGRGSPNSATGVRS
ncbi:expressed unknown protein [Seminavis robusta]|uniref:Dynein axonemal assembly factor 5 TPR repeats domain-containing protein n=1 Tax=Seminavis robusta TaxID=568900 RepID=A0A9N8DF31_9STRA|nr:expressed unknown protein [Seminavis robusta]|eukprot:Sro110_g055020.1 n/a (793) ;mRNA; f:89468-91846